MSNLVETTPNNLTTDPNYMITEADRHATLLADWQERVISEGTAEIKTDFIFAWAKFDANLGDFFVEGKGRTADKIYRAFFRIKTLHYEDLMRAFAEAEPAQRPTRLGDPFNGFWNTCTLAFFLDYCRRFCLDAADLIETAYGDQMVMPEELQEQIFENADWEGIEFPETWSDYEIKQLQIMLTNVNYHELRDQVEILEQIGVYECKTNWTQPTLLTTTALPQLSA
jgi:hypothetical protein